MNEKSERLKKAINYLKMTGEIEKDADIAKKMGADVSNVSRSKKEPPTDKFIVRFCEAYPIFNKSWLLAGDGDMIITMGDGNSVNDLSALKRALDEIAGQRHLTEKAQEQIDELLKQQRILIEALAGKKP